MLIGDFRATPDLRFDIQVLVCEPPCIASRLHFDCAPIGVLFGIPVYGRRVQFHENVIYRVSGGKIRSVWSIVDKAEITEQLE
jgi:predicted ester cyclase